MSRFLRTLVKVGLVELDPEEQARISQAKAPAEAAKEADEVDQLLKETEALLASSGPSPRTAPPPPPPVPSAPSRGASPRAASAPAWTPPSPKAGAATPSGITEGRPLAEIYAEASVPASPFPAEKLLRLIDGLKAMDSAMRRAAITAMDAADDAWALSDPLQDAQRKIAVLNATKTQLGTIVGQAEARAESETRSAEAYQKEATEKIRAQIAELEALLEQELSTVAKQKAETQSRLLATREAAGREGARLDQEIAALSGILSAFQG